jgi:hypothetical protein
MAVLTFTYTATSLQVEIVSVRVIKPDGAVVVTPDYNVQDLPADVTRGAHVHHAPRRAERNEDIPDRGETARSAASMMNQARKTKERRVPPVSILRPGSLIHQLTSILQQAVRASAPLRG